MDKTIWEFALYVGQHVVLADFYFVLKDHEAQCPYTKVQCMYPSCGALVLREDLSRHLEEECMFRQQQCQYCKLMTTADQLKVTNIFYENYDTFQFQKTVKQKHEETEEDIGIKLKNRRHNYSKSIYLMVLQQRPGFLSSTSVVRFCSTGTRRE